MARYGDEMARWVVPRPGYVRESEPGSSAWPSTGQCYVDKAEQAFNRQLFSQGRNRKQPMPVQSAENERKTG